jgi:hypothetical protein
MLSDLLSIFVSEAYAARLLREVRCVYCGSLSVFNVGYRHEYVNHSLGEYARGDVHINNCENRASILRT